MKYRLNVRRMLKPVEYLTPGKRSIIDYYQLEQTSEGLIQWGLGVDVTGRRCRIFRFFGVVWILSWPE